MAPRKSTSRKKRPARGKSSGQSAAAIVTVGAIVALGAAALWTTSQSRSPTASVSGLFRSSTGSSVARTTAPAPKAGSTTSERKTAQAHIEPTVTAPAPLRRPQVNVGEQKQVAMLAPQVGNKPAVQITPPKPAAQSSMSPLPPVGKTAPDDNSRHASGAFKIPKAIIARQALTIREKAWDQAKTVGRVEKGREMRSYAKVGRWHRVVVPSTNIIGWVQEDQLIFKNQPRQAASSSSVVTQRSAITTGSIRPVPASKSANDKPQNTGPHNTAPRNTGLIAPVYPQQPVGK